MKVFVDLYGVLERAWNVLRESRAMKVWLYIKVHPGTHAEILQASFDYRRWIESNSITVVVSNSADT